MCFKEVEPVTLGSGTRPPQVSTRPTESTRVHRSRAAAVAGWDATAVFSLGACSQLKPRLTWPYVRPASNVA